MKNKQLVANYVTFAIVAVVLILLSISFSSSGINDRAIVIGIGVDYDNESSQYVATFEVVSPSSSAEQSGAFSKLITTRSTTIDGAVNAIYSETGQKASLGQCQLLLIGESVYLNNHTSDVLPYFIVNADYKDSSSISFVKGEASDIMKTQLPMNSSISFTLSQLLKDASKYTALPATTTSRFVQSGLQLGKNQQITVVEFVSQDEPATNEGESDNQCRYVADTMALLHNYNYLLTASKQDTIGYTLLTSKAVGQQYTVENDEIELFDSKQLGVAVTSKSVDITVNCDNEPFKVEVNANLSVQSIRHYDVSREGFLHPQVNKQLSEGMLASVREQATTQINNFITLCRDNDIDVLGIYKKIEMELGDKAQDIAENVSIGDMEFVVEVTVVED